MNSKRQAVSFAVFLIIWNRAQGVETPQIHMRMAAWLQDRWDAGDRRLLLMAFRSCGKSTIAGLFAAWLLYRHPDLRILVLAAESSLARRMVRTVRRTIERHPLSAHLKPPQADQWASDRFTVRRARELRDPSMVACGVMGNITGSRADIIICDDVEVPNTSGTAEKRADLRMRLGEMDYVLAPGGTMIYIGTPHHWFTIYADGPRAEIGETRAFLDGFARLTLPVLDQAGNSVWPERYTPEDIARMKIQTGINKFRSQMMLEPVNIAEGRLDPAQLQRYASEVAYYPEIDRLEIDGRRMTGCCAYWDPAFGGGDRSVLAVVFADEGGDMWLHRLAYLRSSSNVDIASAQARQVVAIAKQLRVPSITVETNGAGRLLPALLRRELAGQSVACAVVGHNNSKPKHQRITEALETRMAARMLRVHESVFKTPFMQELQEWRPGRRGGGHDDGLDAVAGAISLLPERVRADRISGRQTWHAAMAHMTRNEFEV